MWLALALFFFSFIIIFFNINVILINKYDFNAFSHVVLYFQAKILQYLNVFYFIIYYNYYCY